MGSSAGLAVCTSTTPSCPTSQALPLSFRLKSVWRGEEPIRRFQTQMPGHGAHCTAKLIKAYPYDLCFTLCRLCFIRKKKERHLKVNEEVINEGSSLLATFNLFQINQTGFSMHFFPHVIFFLLKPQPKWKTEIKNFLFWSKTVKAGSPIPKFSKLRTQSRSFKVIF